MLLKIKIQIAKQIQNKAIDQGHLTTGEFIQAIVKIRIQGLCSATNNIPKSRATKAHKLQTKLQDKIREVHNSLTEITTVELEWQAAQAKELIQALV